MRAWGRALLGGTLLALLCASCPLLGSEEEPFEGEPASADRVPVVDDVGPFDPSEAVDDDDGAVVLADTDDPTDGAAFAEKAPEESRASEAAAGTEAVEQAAPVEAAQTQAEGTEGEKTEGAENELADGESQEPGAPGEAVAAPAEVEAREEERRQEVEQAENGPGDEDEKKAEIADNPPPEPLRESEGLPNEALDFVLETLVIAAGAALISAAVVFARTHPRVILGAVFVCGVLAWFVASQVA